MNYKKEFLDYFLEICNHKEDSIRRNAVFNLPAMCYLFKGVNKESGFSFQDIYYKFSEEDDFDMRYCAASSLHEAFKNLDDDEDTSKIRQCFINYILDNQREILLLINKNLNTIILKYCNDHTIKNFKGRTPYIESSPSSDKGSKEATPKSKQI